MNTPTLSSAYSEALPGDSSDANRSRQVTGAAWSPVAPTPVQAPRVIGCWDEVAALLDLAPEYTASQGFADAMAGNTLLPGTAPYAMCYGGHQFGNWAGQLGDGRAINLGDIVNARDERWTLQLKGAGPTPYSRNADGRAVLRSSVREFLCSEAMFHLGVPTTRALSLTLTGDEVVRDMFYDGHPAPERGAVVCRVAPSFLRFGSFEIFAARGETELLRQLLDFTITQHYPQLGAQGGVLGKDAYLAFFHTLAERTAAMVCDWMRVGFVHGVMNTDNMSALGLTIDYGPYGWTDDFNPDWTPNTTDASARRYRFGQQPAIALWNLAQLGNALMPLIEDVEPLQAAINAWADDFGRRHDAMQLAKLGLVGGADMDATLVTDLLGLLAVQETDMTLFYRALAAMPLEASAGDEPRLRELAASLYDVHYASLVGGSLSATRIDELSAWLGRYVEQVAGQGINDATRAKAMNKVNPKYVLRNYVAQLAIDDADAGDNTRLHALMNMLRKPYDEQPEYDEYAALRPEWARTKAGCSMLSCSS